jgi:ribulose-5-phosphate 4-epimerase/fuculose-1-phosphate aldolase
MSATISTLETGLRPAQFSREEWELRVQLAACYRIFDHFGWTELIYNHITLRVPGPEKHFLINPFGLRYAEVTASNLVKIDIEGNIVSPTEWQINPAGFVIHSAIHEAVPEAHCIMHTHTTTGMAVACSREGLTPTNFYAAQLRDMVAYHDFEGITVNPDEKPRMLKSLGDRQVLILRNHGLLVHGKTIAEAFVTLWTVQRACDIQVATRALGEAIPIPESVVRYSTQESLQFNPKYGKGEDVFAAMVRLVDAKDPSYKR